MSASKFRLAIGALLLSAALLVKPLCADSGMKLALPTPPDKPVHGLFLDIDLRWIEGSGYRPIRVTVGTSSGKPAPADRHLDITIQPRFNASNLRSPFPVVTQEIKLPQGSTTATHTILIPELYEWDKLDWVTREDGQILKELTHHKQNPLPGLPSSIHTEAFPTAIVFHRNAPARDDRVAWVNQQSGILAKGGQPEEFPDLRLFLNEISAPIGSQRMISPGGPSKISVVSAITINFRADILPLSDVPDNWLALSSADLIVLEMQDLQTLKSTQPDQFNALHKWLLAGGNLLICRGGPEGPAKVDSLFDNSEQDASKSWKSASTDAAAESELGIINDLRIRESNGYPGSNNGGKYTPLVIEGDTVVAVKDSTKLPKTNPLTLSIRDKGYGRIVLVQEDPFPGTPDTWKAILGSFQGNRLAWFQRNGMSRVRENNSFWEFLVPGFGRAPVLIFEVLIAVFVILIGPVNYFVLRAFGRLNLLMLTVPVGAVVVTFLLMLYAVLHDGFATNGRFRTVTLLDQTTGQGATWTRQAYYAGLADPEGLSFPADSAVYEIEAFPFQDDHVGEKQVTWNDHQMLSGAYFRSRVTQQYLAIRPFQTERKLEIQSDSTGTKVTNQLGTKILHLLLLDNNGTRLYGENIQPDGQTALTKPDESQLQQLRKQFQEAGLSYPVGFDRRLYVNRTYNRTNYTIRTYQIPEAFRSSADFGTSLLEKALENETNLILNQSAGKRHYLAVVERFPETPVGTDCRSTKRSIEVVVGTWE